MFTSSQWVGYASALRTTAISAIRVRSFAVIGGSLPSGGSTTQAVCSERTPRSNQKSLYAPVLPGGGGRSALRIASASSSARSSAVSVSRPASSSGRSMGVVVVFVQAPCRSGSPHGVRNAFCACAATGASASTATPAATVKDANQR